MLIEKENRQHKCARLIFQLKGNRLQRPLTKSESDRMAKLEAWSERPPWSDEEFVLFTRIVAKYEGPNALAMSA
jgi:hypothetical protein